MLHLKERINLVLQQGTKFENVCGLIFWRYLSTVLSKNAHQ